jgi:hypothetical protein
MVVARKYQFKDLVRGRFFALAGTEEMAMTSLKDIIWMAVTIAMMYMCPANMAVKKNAIMTKVHIVRVMNVCFFFSYSDGAGFSSGIESPLLMEPFRVGLPGSDMLSLASEEFGRLWSFVELLPL